MDRNYSILLDALSLRITMPVMPDDEPFDYLVTQVIADYLADKVEPILDGVIYPSAQGESGGVNVVLFHKAACVESYALPEGTEVSVQLDISTDEGPEIDYAVWEETPPLTPPLVVKDTHDPFKNAFHDPFDLFLTGNSMPELDPDDRVATLRLDEQTLAVHHVERVKVTTKEYAVRRHRYEKRKAQF